MNYKQFNTESWASLNWEGNSISGYDSKWLGKDDSPETRFHVFIDENGHFHFALKVNESLTSNRLVQANLNGLSVKLKTYLLEKNDIFNFIDIECKTRAFLPEFTQVVKEICDSIFIKNDEVLSAVNNTINNWAAFWGKEQTDALTEQEQIGLLCELIVLHTICRIDPERGVTGWVGPFKERHDFILEKYSIEVKGTRSNSKLHTINGIDQLLPLPEKKLLFVSIQVSKIYDDKGVCLSDFIQNIYVTLQNHRQLFFSFNQLLSKAGYSPLHNPIYEQNKFAIVDAQCYLVNTKFPCLNRLAITSDQLERISSIRYNILLDGIAGEKIEKLNWHAIIN